MLLVDDDPTIIAGMGKVLQDFGRVRFACTGPEALQLANQYQPDLVLLDLDVPELVEIEA